MTVGVVAVQLAGSGWTIRTPDGSISIEASKACLAKACKPTGEVQVDDRGIWWIASIGVGLRWASADTVEVRTDGGEWRSADFVVAAPPEKAPPPLVVEEIARWDRGVLPGVWTVGRLKCEAGTTAWHFQPIVAGQPVTGIVDGKPSPGASLAPCKDAAGGSGVVPAG